MGSLLLNQKTVSLHILKKLASISLEASFSVGKTLEEKSIGRELFAGGERGLVVVCGWWSQGRGLDGTSRD